MLTISDSFIDTKFTEIPFYFQCPCQSKNLFPTQSRRKFHTQVSLHEPKYELPVIERNKNLWISPSPIFSWSKGAVWEEDSIPSLHQSSSPGETEIRSSSSQPSPRLRSPYRLFKQTSTAFSRCLIHTSVQWRCVVEWIQWLFAKTRVLPTGSND